MSLHAKLNDQRWSSEDMMSSHLVAEAESTCALMLHPLLAPHVHFVLKHALVLEYCAMPASAAHTVNRPPKASRPCTLHTVIYFVASALPPGCYGSLLCMSRI